MLIKHKLMSNTAIIVVAMIFMLRLLSFSVDSLQDDVGVARDIGHIVTGVLELRRNEKDFLARKDTKYLDKFTKKVKNINNTLKSLENAFKKNNEELTEICAFFWLVFLPNLTSIIIMYHCFFREPRV